MKIRVWVNICIYAYKCMYTRHLPCAAAPDYFSCVMKTFYRAFFMSATCTHHAQFCEMFGGHYNFNTAPGGSA